MTEVKLLTNQGKHNIQTTVSPRIDDFSSKDRVPLQQNPMYTHPMSEADIIARTRHPLTEASLLGDLQELGIKPGMSLLVHSSLSTLGWVCGGALAVIRALERAVSPGGTTVMPTQSCQHSDPAAWQNPPVPEEWVEILKENFPPYDPVCTPTRNMGRIPELFRTLPGVFRSRHPLYSFAASGPKARALTAAHPYDYSLGPGSPLAKLYDLDGFVLLIGVDNSSNTSLHLAEYLADYPGKKEIIEGAPRKHGSRTEWESFKNIELVSDDFEEIGSTFEWEFPQHVRRQTIGCASVRLIRQRPLVDYAVTWMAANRT